MAKFSKLSAPIAKEAIKKVIKTGLSGKLVTISSEGFSYSKNGLLYNFRELCSNGLLYSYIFLQLYVIHFYIYLYQLYV